MKKSTGSDGIHPRVLRELAELLTKPLSIIYQQFYLTSEVPVDRNLENVMPINKKGNKESLWNYKSVCQSDLSAWEGYGEEKLECMYRRTRGSSPARMDL